MIDVDIVTPSRKVVASEKAQSVTMPGASGEMVVYPGHTELVSTLETGPLYVQTENSMRQFAISHGFCLVSRDKVIVLAETCEEAHEIDRARAELSEKNAQESLVEYLTGDLLKKYQLKLKRSQLRQKMAADRDS